MYRNFTPPRPDRQAWKIKTGKGKIMLAFSKRVCYHIPAREVHVHAPVAQLDRVTDYESVGRGFESLLAYQRRIIRTCSQWEMGSDYLFSWVNLRKRISETVLSRDRKPSQEGPGKRSRFR